MYILICIYKCFCAVALAIINCTVNMSTRDDNTACCSHGSVLAVHKTSVPYHIILVEVA